MENTEVSNIIQNVLNQVTEELNNRQVRIHPSCVCEEYAKISTDRELDILENLIENQRLLCESFLQILRVKYDSYDDSDSDSDDENIRDLPKR